MTALEALASVEAAVLECKKRSINPAEVTDRFDYEETRWVEIMSTESRFFSAKRLQCLCGAIEAATTLL